MSNIFLKNELNEIFDTATESNVSNVSLPKWINIVDIANQTKQSTKKTYQSGGVSSATSSAFMGDGDDAPYSATSSVFATHNGNEPPLSATSSAYALQKGDDDLLSTTSAINFGQNGGGAFSATSTMTFGQNGGGAFSATSSLTFGQKGGASNSLKDVNKLISMLTSESSSANQYGGSETSTNSLEQQLHSILSLNGGSKLNLNSNSNSNKEVNDIKNFFMNLKSQGVDVNVKLNNKSMTEFFDLASNTTTDLPLPPANINSESATSIFDVTNFNTNNLSETSSVNMSLLTKQAGGAKKKKSSKKTSKKTSKKSSKKSSKDLDGGVNAGFQAFLDLKKHVAEKLGVSNGPKAAKVAGAVQKDMKEKHPNLDSVAISKKGIEHFNANMAHYKQMLPK